MSEMIKDMEAFIPSPKILTIAEKSFDLSEIPFEYSLRFYELLHLFQKVAEGNFLKADDYNKLFPVIYDMLKFLDDSLDEKWLRRKITIKTFGDIFTTISSAIFFDGKKKEEEAAEVVTAV